MKHVEAIEMIEAGVSKKSAQRWIDLGAGTGFFTRALTACLDTDGVVYAMDKQNQLPEISSALHTAKIIGLELDFVHDKIPVVDVNGILMANSFHYVREKNVLINKLRESLAA